MKMFRQLTTPSGHLKERIYPKLVRQDGDVQKYSGLKVIKKDETTFAAYDKAEIRKAEIMIVANSEFVYTSKSLFWPDFIMRTKPEANQWLHLSPRVAALGGDAFEQGPVMITKIHAYLLKEVSLAENAEEKTAEFVNRMCQITLETFWIQEVKGNKALNGQIAYWKGWEPDGPRPSWQKSTRKSLIT